MSENEKSTIPGEPISEELLDSVSGGFGEFSSDATRDTECWFEADGTLRTDGRMRCKAECRGKFYNDKPVIAIHAGFWRHCRCWGTDECIDKWHKHCGLPNRWQRGETSAE